MIKRRAVLALLAGAAAAFPLAARRTQGLLNPMIPFFLTCHGPRRVQVEAARNAGVTDVLARPISAATVKRKLLQAIVRPRAFIASTEFFGPDRRGKERIQHKGPERRARQPRKVKVSKAASQTRYEDGDITLL